jgi:hypothetical protein
MEDPLGVLVKQLVTKTAASPTKPSEMSPAGDSVPVFERVRVALRPGGRHCHCQATHEASTPPRSHSNRWVRLAPRVTGHRLSATVSRSPLKCRQPPPAVVLTAGAHNEVGMHNNAGHLRRQTSSDISIPRQERRTVLRFQGG